MIRYYCDTNVFSFIKETSANYNKELHETMNSLKDIVLFTFSDAHIDDKKNSHSDKLVINDLELMEIYVRDNYFEFDLIGSKRTTCLLKTPLIAYTGKNYQQADFCSIDSIIDELEMDGIEGSIKRLLNKLFDLQISLGFDKSNMDAKSIELVNRMFGQDNQNIKVRDLVSNTMKFGEKLIYDSKEVSNLRNYVSDYYNSNEYSFEQWGNNYGKQLSKILNGYSLKETISKIYTHLKGEEKIYNEFIMYYSLLEMFNVTVERTGKQKKRKKFNYESLNNDARHAWYGAFSDFLVTDDKGLQIKAFLTYKEFNINTKVLSLKDFTNSQIVIRNNEETRDKLFDSLQYDLKNAFQFNNKYSFQDSYYFTTYKTTHSYFNFFNRLQCSESDGINTLILYCERGFNPNWILYREIELLVNKAHYIFGKDNKGRVKYEFDKETESQDSLIRHWSLLDMEVSINLVKVKTGNYLNMQIDYLN